MFLRILATTVILMLAASSASAGIIISQDGILVEMSVSSCDFDASDSPDEETPIVRDGKSQGMSASTVSTVKTSNPQALEDSYRLLLPRFKPRNSVDYENVQLPACPILDGLLKPS